jgi:hypothetical protein
VSAYSTGGAARQKASRRSRQPGALTDLIVFAHRTEEVRA